MKNPAAESKRMRAAVHDPAPVDTESRRAELADIVGSLDSPRAASPARARKTRISTYAEFRRFQKKQHVILAAALLILIPGVCSFAFTYATRPDEPLEQPEVEVVLPVISPQEEDEIHALSRKLESKAPNDRTAQAAPPLPPPNYKAERDALLRSLAVDGEAPEFVHASRITFSAGKAVTCYCLLIAPLDAATEEAWEQAGMFRGENEIISPLLRQVYLENEETAKRLLIGTVEGVALDLNNPAK